MTVFLGLTGSIGMGKSTTAEMFRKQGIAVFDADATVHALYEGDDNTTAESRDADADQGAAVALIEDAFPGTVINGKVDRTILSAQVIGNEAAMKKLEAIIHPPVRRQEQKFRKTCVENKDDLAILDNPLLFEMQLQDQVDGIIVVTAPEQIQRQRVLARPGMTEEKFNALLKRQIPDFEKRQQADFIIDTSNGLDAAEQDVVAIINLFNQDK